MEKSQYELRGASATKSQVHSAISGQDKGLFPHAFCKLVPDMYDADWCCAMHADGAGTKSALAYIKYKETGDVSVFRGIAQDSLVMNLDDLLCVGAYDKLIFSNTIGRNAHRVGGEVIKQMVEGYSSFCEKMAGYGINIVMSGGETADVGDLVSTVIADSTFFARIRKRDVISCDGIRPGDLIIGLSSSGQAVYEDKYNAGMGSNGLTASRHVLLSKYYKDKYPETCSTTIPSEYAYSGRFRLEDALEGTEVSVGDALLSPTRTYAPIVKEVLEKYREGVHGMIHCTGGGQSKCKNFGEGLHYIKDSLFKAPPLFSLLRRESGMSGRELYQVFNMGHRMELYCAPCDAADIMPISEKYGVEAKIIGYVQESGTKENKVTVRDCGEEFVY